MREAFFAWQLLMFDDDMAVAITETLERMDGRI